jgi:hypothetical protein
MKGFWTISQILKWLQSETMNAVFLPRSVFNYSHHCLLVHAWHSLPAPLFNASPTKQKSILRLVYRTLPDSHSSAEATNLVKVEVSLPQLGEPPDDMFGISDSEPMQEPKTAGSDFTLIEASWWQGNGVSVDLMMPDRYFSCVSQIPLAYGHA